MIEYDLHYQKWENHGNGLETGYEELLPLKARDESSARSEAMGLMTDEIRSGNPYLIMSKYGIRSKKIDLTPAMTPEEIEAAIAETRCPENPVEARSLAEKIYAQEFARKGGKARSAKKTAAARENGKKGGRPRNLCPICKSSINTCECHEDLSAHGGIK